MIFTRRLKTHITQLPELSNHLIIPPSSSSSSSSSIPPSALLPPSSEIDRIAKLINDHPFPASPLHPLLHHHLIHLNLLSTPLVESVLGRLFSGHANGLKALELFKFSLQYPTHLSPSPDSFEKTLHIITRMHEFDKAWELMREIHLKHPWLITNKALSIVLSKYAKFQSFEDTLEVFDEMEKLLVGRRFGVDEFNILLRAFCTQRQMKEARAVFRKLHSRFSPNTQTLNILLLGFKESGDITSVELFYHEMMRRGFKPNVITYNIRIDAYCKKGCLSDALRIMEEMEGASFSPTLETITTLIHGAGIARNPIRARRLFDEIPMRNLRADVGAYNALMGSLFRARDLKGGLDLMDEMEEKGIGHDNVTYHTMFLGLKNSDGVGDVCELYRRMVKKDFVPKMRTVVMLMKFFCENQLLDLGLDLWDYMVGKGCCPHGHALDLLVTALCCRGKVEEAYRCMKQVVARGRHPSEEGFRVLEGFLVRSGEREKLEELDQMMKRLQAVLPPSRGHAVSLSVAISMI
ncbi:pentatricopeptide repeat-containing protein At3g61360 [Magnolia sinica]|uniref:pentatricopeptide repeat-containing protein At3g61360 n=1 Tax=Magnolia sinica TaxID=86752 RepID=UPI00265A67BA|nr:pentatricopeptide repeat-containing protein At3g61360 [Magnolia sinica]